ncbi:polysaccharide deacetylase family protein [Chloroflexota bacterium]
MKNGLSFDVEDSHQLTYLELTGQLIASSKQVVVSVEKILEILANNRVRATFNILGLVAEAFPELIRRIHTEGHELGSHGYHHIPIRKQNPEEFIQDLKESLALLEQITGSKVKGYRAPDWLTMRQELWITKILAKQGLDYDSSILPIKNVSPAALFAPRQPYLLTKGPDSRLIELAPCVGRFAGCFIPLARGRYLRLVPYWLIKRMIKKMNKEGIPAIIDIHSYEFDPVYPSYFWPILGLRPLQIMVSSRLIRMGRRSVEKKLNTLLHDFEFVPLSEVAANELNRYFPNSSTLGDN